MHPEVKKALNDARTKKRNRLELQALKEQMQSLKEPDKKLLAKVEEELAKLA